MITGLAHAAVTVKDMAESLRFYTEALGFQRAFDIRHPVTDEPWIVYLNISHGQFLELFYGGTEDCPWRDSLIGFNHLPCRKFWMQDIPLIRDPNRVQISTGRPGQKIRTGSGLS